MQTTQRRHCYSVYCPKVVLLFLAIYLSGTATAQAQQRDGINLNLQYYDSHFLHYGMILGLQSTRYTVLYSEEFATEVYDSLHSIHSKNSLGFKLGFVLNARIMQRLDFRILPTVGFYENMLEYRMLDGTTQEQLRDYALLEIPMLLKYKSARRNNHRVYLLVGVVPAFEVSQEKDIVKKNNLLRTARQFFSIEVGVGLDIYNSFFKLAPEIRYSHSMQNVLIDDDNYYQRALKSLTPHTISLYLTFEGGAY